MPTPDLPGTLVPRRSEQESWLRANVSRLCQLDHDRFPGSQPVSFGKKDLEKLESQDFWVCEKSDGVRVLLVVEPHPDAQSVYIIDRHNTYRSLTGMFFPHYENPRAPLGNTIIDGELVIDVDPRTKQETLRFLAFDCLVVDNQNVMSRPLDKRYGRLKEWFYKPYARMMRDMPDLAQKQSFDIKVKEISFSYAVDKVFSVDIPILQHGTDGLIYTCVNTPYSPGTDPNILKWKPPSENSIDFKLVLRFPPLASNPTQPDYQAKPFFALHVWCGDERGVSKYEPYDQMFVDDAEWEKMKESGEQFDDRIIEVHWDTVNSCWRIMRFRDDKPNGNHRSVVENIIQSIADGVEKDSLLARSNAIRTAWKMRHGQPQQSQLGHPKPLPPPQAARPPRPSSASNSTPPPRRLPPPDVEVRYGPLGPSRWSKVAGPPVVAGMNR